MRSIIICRTHLVRAVGGPMVLLADPALDHALRRLLLQQLQRRLLARRLVLVGLVLYRKTNLEY